ncbi:hypothetical protein R3P38DRAFT_2550153 [Favolaschia claudopus]|uniref:C3H1-type domain-containing protein n=1 Tax=Favolaschia claudopus TaxID=2862362 RepID=A0AAW0AIS5_9AGAR
MILLSVYECATNASPDAANGSENVPLSGPPSDLASAALLAQKRPERVDGLQATSAASLVPEIARKRFAEGWRKHVPLNLLTDEACSILNRVAAAKEFDDTYALDGTRGIVPVPKEISMDKERALGFTDWWGAWQRLLDLIRTYVPLELGKWRTHFTYICAHREDSNWAVWAAYDSEVRYRSTVSSLDPAVFHDVIYNAVLKRDWKSSALEELRAELRNSSTTHASSSSTRFHPYNDSNSNSNSNSNSRSKNQFFRKNQNQAPLAITNGENPAGPRCFICGNRDPSHQSRSCDAQNRGDGRPTVLGARSHDGSRVDSEGNRYCFAWNGRRGCQSGAYCRLGHHWCSLCGAQDGSHPAQRCRAV